MSLVNAAVIGANKGVLSYRNVLKNGYAQELVTLTTDTDFDLSITYKIEGEVEDWIRLEPPEQPFFISKDKPYTVAVIIEPPADAQNQEYKGAVRFITGALAGPGGQFGTAVRAAINLRLGAEITGQEIIECSASGFQIDDVEEGYPLEFYAVVSNKGNVRLTPEFTMEFWNQDQSELVETFQFSADKSILPTTQERVFHSIEHNLDIGQYWVRISTPTCGAGSTGFITVSVIERGGVSDKGDLIRIDAETWVKVGDIVPIDAIFKNLGSRVVSAKFKGTITSGDEIFKIIDTDILDVVPGETVSLRTFFNPVQEGQYIIQGRVLYNKKLTFEKSSVINVNPSGKAPVTAQVFNWSTVLIILIIIIIILIILILRKRKKDRHRRYSHKSRVKF
ncbi:MAG: hypothetical protein KKE98_02565 [Nanoarchaeota archaeon]|nr:hypothetical protein [Nanoarchaeota archaeon]MBU1597304.1 hypothetical protein [Nanoarchaeota archaeon]